MRKFRKKSGGANWMDTYGDMVTLLLCFFVLLYSISAVDQEKWENFVMSVNPDAKKFQEIPSTPGGPTETPVESGEGKNFEEIYDELNEAMTDLGVEEEISIVKGEGYYFISYNDKVFFNGDSAEITEGGAQVLDAFCKTLKPMADKIKEIRVLGHTSQASPDTPNDVAKDRMLASNRATNVVIYIQEKNIVSPSILVSMGYGQFHPIASFDTEENRSKNRRAEIIITEKGSDEKSLSDYYEEIYGEDITE